MPPELTLNLKCPACGELSSKPLAEIKAQKEFYCSCGYYADLTPRPMPTKDRKGKKQAIA